MNAPTAAEQPLWEQVICLLTPALYRPIAQPHRGGTAATVLVPADRMSREEAAAPWAATSPRRSNRASYTLLTWNGVGFDLDILAEESGMRKRVQ